MNEDVIKSRLLQSIGILNMVDNHNIKLEHIGLKIEKFINIDGYNMTIFSDVIMDKEELSKYNKENSQIMIDFTLYDNDSNIIDTGDVTVYFDGGLFDSEFKGSKTIKFEFRDLKLENIDEIEIQIDAYLDGDSMDDEFINQNSDPEPQIITDRNLDEYRTQIIKSIERIPKIEEKFGITIENFGLNIENDLTFFAETSIESTDWSFIEFKCVLYDENNAIIDSTFTNISSHGFIGFDTIRFLPLKYHDNIAKVKIYPSQVTPK